MKFLDAILPTKSRATQYIAGGVSYSGSPVQMTWSKTPAEPIGSNFDEMVTKALMASSVVSAVEMVRMSVFAEARFQWQRFNKGRPGELYGSPELSLLERPWPGGTTGDLLSRMILDADFAGNAYVARIGDELVRLRPDWTDIVLAARIVDVPDPLQDQVAQVGYKRAGYAYYEGGNRADVKPVFFLADEVAHFAPYPDPLAVYRGMSWLSPICREIETDKQGTEHRSKWFENAATPNLAISLPRDIGEEEFFEFTEMMDKSHKGSENAGKTLYLAGGADPTVIGANMQQMDFKAVQGASETRIAAAGGIHPVIVGLSEGLSGSSLNAGNYSAAKRSVGDRTMRPLWRNVSGSLEVLLDNPDPATRLWIDDRDVAFLRDDEMDRAQIAAADSQIIRTLGDGGWEQQSIKAAVKAGYDWDLLVPTGLIPVQLQPPGAGTTGAPA